MIWDRQALAATGLNSLLRPNNAPAMPSPTQWQKTVTKLRTEGRGDLADELAGFGV